MAKTVLAIDLGASSGRAILGTPQGGEITLQEVYRFPNGYHEVDGHLYWDVESLFENILIGIKKALEISKTKPCMIEVKIDRDINVLPMIPAGKPVVNPITEIDLEA